MPIFFDAHERNDFAVFTSNTYCLHFVLFLFFLRKSLPALLPDLSIFKSHFTPSTVKSKSDCPAFASGKLDIARSGIDAAKGKKVFFHFEKLF